jgi:hypothetical protein
VTVPAIYRYAVWVNATVARILSLLPLLFMRLSVAMEREQTALGPKAEDYGLSDRVIEGKFLTSQIQLVLLEHRAVSRLQPNHGGSMACSLALPAYWTVACPYNDCLDSEDLLGPTPRL